MPKIDVFPHILPRRYFERMLAVAPPGMALQKRMSGIPVLVDVDLRFRIMDRYEGYAPTSRASPMTRWRRWSSATPSAFPPSSPRCP